MNLMAALKPHINRLLIAGIVLLVGIFLIWFLFDHSALENNNITVLPPKKPAPVNIETLLPPVLTPIHYTGNDSTDPFANAVLTTISATETPLERYPLDALHLVGILQRHGQWSAVISTPEEKVYTVLVGDLLGTQHGVITAIEPSALRIHIPANPEAGIVDQNITLLLKGRSS